MKNVKKPVVVSGKVGNIADDKADGEVKIAVNVKRKFDAAAQADALAVVHASELRNQADMSFRDLAIARGVELKRDGWVLNTENALHPLHSYYLDTLATNLMRERKELNAKGEGKASAYTRRVKSDFAAILGAIQIGECMLYNWTDKADKAHADMSAPSPADVKPGTKVSEVKTQAAALLKDAANVQRAVITARTIKAQAGFISGKGKKQGSVKSMSTPTLEGMLGKMEGRLVPTNALAVLQFAMAEIRGTIKPGNRKVFDNLAADFVSSVKDCIAKEMGAEVTDIVNPVVGKGERPAVKVPAKAAAIFAKLPLDVQKALAANVH